MKIKLLFTLFTFSTLANAQDLILKKDLDEIKSQVIKVGTNEIEYKKFENPKGPTYTISKTDVIMIKYANGTKDVFNADNTNTNQTTTKTNTSESTNTQQSQSQSVSMKGVRDADMYYHGQNSGAGGTLATTIVVGPIIGLIPAIACSSTRPQKFNLNVPDGKMLDNPEYMRGYEQEAWHIKKRKVWGHYGIGCSIIVGLIIILTAAAG